MKLFEQLKSNASRMAVYAILVATALCGIAAPVYAKPIFSAIDERLLGPIPRK